VWRCQWLSFHTSLFTSAHGVLPYVVAALPRCDLRALPFNLFADSPTGLREIGFAPADV
jgi:hypothetical protein